MESQYFCSPNHIPPGWDRCEQGTACFPTDSVAVLPWKRNSSPGQPLILKVAWFQGRHLNIFQCCCHQPQRLQLGDSHRFQSENMSDPEARCGSYRPVGWPGNEINFGHLIPPYAHDETGQPYQLFGGRLSSSKETVFVCRSFGRAQRKKNRSRS